MEYLKKVNSHVLKCILPKVKWGGGASPQGKEKDKWCLFVLDINFVGQRSNIRKGNFEGDIYSNKFKMGLERSCIGDDINKQEW